MAEKKQVHNFFIVTTGHAVQFGDSPVLTEGTFFSCSDHAAEYHVRNGHARKPLADEVPANETEVFLVKE